MRILIGSALAITCLFTVAHADGPPGVVINHLSPATRQYIGSPSVVILPGGEYVASHDVFGPGSTRTVTVLFASADQGLTWSKRATVPDQFWSTLFVHRGGLYLFGTSKEYGNCIIRKSTEGGHTWSEPSDSMSGRLLDDGRYHCAPVPVVIHGGRIWRAMEEYTGPRWGAFKAFVMSAPETSDLLLASSWTCTTRIGVDPAWLGGKVGGILEGNAVVTPDGGIVDILRVEQPSFDELAAMMRVSGDGRTLSFDAERDFLRLPGGVKKFTIRYDDQSKRYWTLVNDVPTAFRQNNRLPAQTRNTLSLASSVDLRKWDVERQILQGPNFETIGFQYADWQFDGADMIAVVRTAFPEADGTNAHNYHDANWLTFHRISGFRSSARE